MAKDPERQILGRKFSKQIFSIVDLASRVNRECGQQLGDEVAINALSEWKSPEAPNIWKEFIHSLPPRERSIAIVSLSPFTSRYWSLYNPQVEDLGHLRRLSIDELKQFRGMSFTRMMFVITAFNRIKDNIIPLIP